MKGGEYMKYTEEDKNNIINDYNNDVRLIDIGAKYNVSGDTITYYLKKWGIPSRDRRKYKFTEEDILFLKQEYPNGNWDVIKSRFPNVSKSKIHRVMSDYNIRRDTYFWSEHDKMILKQYYGELSTKDIQPMLHREYSIDLIQNQAQKMGLTRSRNWSEEELKILYDNYKNIDIHEICKLIPDKSANAVSLKASSLGLSSYWANEHYYTKEEDEFLYQNYVTMSNEELAEGIGRTVDSVKGRKHALGLVRIFDKSGYVTLNKYVRMNICDWKKKSMEKCNYRCVLTGDKFDEIHHIYSFNLMFKEALDVVNLEDYESISDYTDNELMIMLNAFKDIQDKHSYGVCLRKDIHCLFHNIYGRGKTTEEQWDEFVLNFKNGIYVDIIK